jgi:hypothetical protein
MKRIFLNISARFYSKDRCLSAFICGELTAKVFEYFPKVQRKGMGGNAMALRAHLLPPSL